MATEADIQLPLCEARGEQAGNFVDNAIKISVSDTPLQKQNQDDKHSELPIVEGETFLKSPLIFEVRCEANAAAPDVSKVIEETSEEEREQNAEESNSKGGDGDRGVVPEKCIMDSSVVTPEMKAGDTIDDPCTDDATGVTRISKETSSDHHGTYDSSTTKEILLESSLPSKKTESHTPCISEGEELKITDGKSADEKPTEEDVPSNLTNEMTPEQEALENETSVEDNFNTAAEQTSYENSTSGETIGNSNRDELQSKCDSNTSFSKEEEKAVQKGDESVTRSEDCGVTPESDSHGVVECQVKTLEDAATDHGDSKLAEKSEPVLVEDSNFEEESEKLPLTQVSMGSTTDDVPAAKDNVKDKDEDLKEFESSENEQSTRCTWVKEDMHIENSAESLHVVPEVSDLSQENSIKGPPEEQSTNVTLHGNTIEAEEAAIDGQKESLEPIISSSHEEGSMAAVLKEATSDHTDGKIIDEVDEHKEVLENLSSGEANNVSPDVTEKTDQPIEVGANEEIQQNIEESKDGGRDAVAQVCSMDSLVVTLHIKGGDTPDMDDAKVATQLSLRHGTENATLTEEILQETDLLSKETESHTPGEHSSLSKEEETAIQRSDESVTTPEDYRVPSVAAADHSNPNLAEKSEERSLVLVEDEHLEEERERRPLTESSTGGTNDNVSAATDDDEEHKEAELSEREIENAAESLHVAVENIQVATLSQENYIKALPEEQSTVANLHGNTIKAEEVIIDGQKDSHESFPPIDSGSPEEGSMNAVLEEATSDHTEEKIIDEVYNKHDEVIENLSTTEEAEGNSLIILEGSEYKKEDDSGKESEEKPLPLPLAREVSEARFEDGEPKKAELCDDERDTEPKTESRTEKIEDVHVNSEDTKAPHWMDKRSEGGTVDAAEEREETFEVQNVPNEKLEENSFIQVGGQEMESEEHLDKENEQLSSTKDYTVNAHNDEVIVKDEDKTEDENPSGAELFEKDKNIGSVLLTEQVQSERPLEVIKTSGFSQHREETEEQIPAENSQGIPSDETEETGIDAANTNEKLQNVSNEDSDKDLLIEVATSEMTHDVDLKEEPERPSLTETSKEEASESKTGDEYPSKVEFPNDEKSADCIPKKESLQPEDYKTSTPSADIETTYSLEEQSLAENSQSNKIIDAADQKEVDLENVATETPHEHIEENLVIQVDCSAREHEEPLEEDNQTSSLIEAPTGVTDARESKNIDESENRGEESITPELENTESTYVKEETYVDKTIDSLQVKPEDIKQHDSNPDINKSTDTEEEISDTDPREISTDEAEPESVDAAHTNEGSVETKDVAKDIPDCYKEDSIPIEEVGSQNSLNEASADKANDEESTKVTEGSLKKKEEPLESLKVAAQDIETPPLSLDRETSSLHEQSSITNPEAIMDDNKEEIADNATGEEDETPKDKVVGKDILDCGKEDNIPIEEVGSQKPLDEASAGNENNEDSTKITKGSLIEEEASLKSPQEATQEIEMPPFSRDREISSIDEQSPIANPEGIRDDHKEEIVDNETVLEGETPKDKQNIANTTPYEDKEENLQVQEDNVTQEKTADPQDSCDETQKKTVDATNEYNDVITSVPSGDGEDNSTTEVDGLQEPSSEEVNAEKINDDDEGKIVESLQVADEDIKDTSSGQDREARHLEEQAPTTDSHGTMGDKKDAKTLDSTDLKKETLEDKNYATTPDESTKEDSLNQVDGLLLEHEEHSEKDGESTSLTDAPKDISSSKITEKIVDASGNETQEVQDTEKSAPWEDDSTNEQNTEFTLIKEDVSIELPQTAAEDRESPCLSEVRETDSQEEQILGASPGVRINDNEENKTIDPTVFENETPKDEVPKEMESVDVKGETKEEEGCPKAVQMTTAVIEASSQERSLNLTAEETSSTEDLNVNKEVIGHIPEVSNYKQQDSPVMKVLEEHKMKSNEHSTSMESEKNNDQVDKTDLEKIQVLNDGPSTVPTSETLAETDSRGCTETEVQVPNGEKEAQVIKREAENDQETLPEDVSESKEVNGEEEIELNNCKDISSSPISVEVSTSNVALQEDSTSNSVTDLETKNEEEAPPLKETVPSSAESQDVESVSVEENSNYAGSLTQEKSDSNEVAFTPGENKSGYESNSWGLESIAQVQSFHIISKTEEEDLKAEAEIQPDKAETEDILQEKTTCEQEIMKEDISSEKEQLPRIKEEREDIKDYRQGSCEEEVITDSHQEDEIKQDQHANSKETYEFTKNGNETKTVPKVSEEADGKASEDLEKKIFTNEAIDGILNQEEQETSIKATTKIENENAHELDIACVKTDTQDSNKEAVPIAVIHGRESEEQNKEDEICISDEVQVQDEENLRLSEGKSEEEAKETYNEAYVEAEKFDLSSQTKNISECAISDVGDNEKSTAKKFSEEDYPKKITACGNEDIALTEQPSEDAFVTAEVQEAKAGIDLGAAEATGLESQEVEELNDKCTEMADTSTPVETPVISTSKNIGESTERTPLEAEDQQTKLDDLPEESNMRDTEVKTAEKDDAVNLQSVQGQELCKRASNNHNPVPEERIETSEEQERKPIQNAPVSETPNQEIEEQKLGRDTADVDEEEKNIPSQLESVYGADIEKVPESSIHQSSVAQHDKKEGNKQTEPDAQCSDIKTSENEPAHVGGTDVTELEASPLSLKDKHVVLKVDGDENISTQHSQGEHEVVKSSKVEQEEEECGIEEMQGRPESEETGKPSLSDPSDMVEKGPTGQTEDVHAENIDENTKTDEEKDDELEQNKSDLGSEAPVMVDIGDADMKVAHKKSHNILSGVGSKVKHSIAKVKKAIAGKSPSPKKVINPESK